MKKRMTRIMALVLIISMLLPCLPAGVVAVEGGAQTEPVQVVYDFVLEQTDKVNNNGSSFAGQALTGTANQGAIAGYYAAGELNWKYAADNNLSFKTESNQSFAMLYFGGGSNVWTGLRLGIKTEENDTATYPVGVWSALTIKVPTAGKYALNLDHQIRADGTTAGEIYFLEGTYADNAAIEAAMAATNPQKTVDFSKNNFDVEDSQTSLGKKQLNAGEYTLVFKATAKRTEASACFFYLKKLTMTMEEEVNTDDLKNVSYNFLQTYVNEQVGKSFNNKYFTAIPNADIDEAYADEALNWKIAASNADAMLAQYASSYIAMDTYMSYGNGSNWAGLRLAMRGKIDASNGTYLTGHWYAFTLASPGEGNFDITLKYQTRSDANRDTKVYLLPGALTDPAEIQAAMDNATSLTTGFDARVDNAGNISNTSTTYVDATKSLGVQSLTDNEYTLVIHAASSNGVGFYLTGLEMNERLVIEDTTGDTTDTTAGDTSAPEDTTAPEEILPQEAGPYTFALGGTDLTVGGSSFAGMALDNTAVMDAVGAYYAEGVLNWKFTGLNNFDSFNAEGSRLYNMYYIGGTETYKWSGIRLGLKVETDAGNTFPAGVWTAMTLRSPGKGLYEITLNYQTRSDATSEGEIYLIKGTFTDPAEVEAKLTKDNLLKVIDCSSKVVDFADKDRLLGTVELEQGEYTMVFRAAKAPKGGNYFYINDLIFNETQPKPELPPVQKDKLVYNFALSGTEFVDVNGEDMAGQNLTATKIREALDEYFKDQKLYWTFAANNLETFKKDDNAVESVYYFGGGPNNYVWTGLRMGHKVLGPEKEDDGDLKPSYPPGYFTALNIHSPGKGYYKLTLDFQMRADGTSTGEIYLIKGKLTDVAQIEKQLTKDNLLKVVDFSSKSFTMSDNKKELGGVEMEKGEYTLVFRAMDAQAGGGYIYLNALTAEKTQPEPPKQPLQVNKLVYDFVLNNEKLVDDTGATFTARKLTDKKILAALDEYYDSRTLYWDYALDNRESFQKKDNEVSDMYYIGGNNYKWAGLRLGLKVAGPELDKDGTLKPNYPEGWWTALTLESPGKGTYYLSLDYQSRADGTPEGEIYLVKGKFTDAVALEKQLNSGNLLKTVNFNSRGFDMVDKQIDLGPVDLVQGEYTIVFKSLVPSKSAGAYMYVTKLTATHESIMPPPGPNEVIYDFDLQDRENGVYEKRIDLQAVWGDLDLNQRYASGKINWNYYTKDNTMPDTGHCFASSYGMYMFALQDQWMAFKIKSPGNGLYTLTMNHARGGNGGTGAVYILPGDTKDIASAMDPSNRVGKITFANETGEPQVTDGFTTQLGTYNFKAGEEYIMVMEAYKNSPFKAKNSYMWISQLIALEGNHMKTQTASKKINSVVVDEAPVVQFGIGMYGAVSQVNGQDYFYFPTEGKQMFIYNLDDMVKVRKVTTPFTSSKGMCVDKDGMVWMVGDAQVLWRYDPYTNTGWTSANFKTTGGIENSSTALYCTAGSDGNIYFGTYTMGYVVRYNPTTDKFSKVTGGLINEDSSYSSGIIERDGYLYAAINGDRNADGKVTAEYVKIDLKADKIVGRVDITEQFGQDEVMVRGVGICGDTLFAGGISMKGFVAIDINTMELKDYGIANQIAIGTTEEIDGKIYFMLSGAGIRMYDSATDEITIPNKMESALAGFRCGETNAVTLDHNPLFPGISYVTFGGTGIKIYNVESGNVYTPPLIDEENDGSGQVIRTVIRGPEGTNTLYIGGFNTDTSAVYDITQGKTTKLFETEGQGDTLMWYDGVLYAGNYPGAYVTRVNLDDPDRNVVMLSLSGGHYQQARIHALTAGDGMLFAGSIPDWYGYGGTFVAIDLETLDRTMIEQMVQYQSITGLVYRDGYVFGTTSLSGGTAADEPYNDEVSAKIFVYDVKQKKKVAELDLREHISGLADRLPYVDGITVDPNGQLWGVISETVFQFDYKPETGKFTVKEILSFDKSSMSAEGRSWKMCDFDYLDGFMYVALGSKGGLQKININNPSEHYRINCETPRNFVIGEDGNLYYALNTYELKMYPLHITDEDWEIAAPVDAMILALKGKSSIDDKEQILAAKNAYEALSWEHKALIQNYEILEIAITDLLEAEIDTIGEVTLESEALIKRLLEEYEALPRKQQGYVKNYQTLNAADLKLQELINQREADRVQKILDDGIAALGEITLEDEEAIKALRATFDELTFLQRQLVDASGLLAAEAKIKELRQVRIDRLIELIAQIGEVTLEDEELINEAMEIYNWMYMDEREQVDYVALTAANKALQKLQKDAAAAVDELITAIGDSVDYSSGNAIKAARAAYDALTPGSKQYVTMLSILEEAEAIYAEMFPLWAIIVIAAVGVAAAGGAVTAVLLRKRKSAEPKEEQITE